MEKKNGYYFCFIVDILFVRAHVVVGCFYRSLRNIHLKSTPQNSMRKELQSKHYQSDIPVVNNQTNRQSE